MAQPLLFSAGDVIDVQLSSETVVFDGGGEGDGAAHVTKRMRLFVRDLDGKEQKYDFEGTELGVRDTQRVVIVRGAVKGAKQPVNLVLINQSSGEHDTFEPGLRAFLAVRSWFSPPLQAIAAALIFFVLFWLVTHFGMGKSAGFANTYGFFSAAMLFPIFWWIAAKLDALSYEWRFRAARSRLIADARGRARAYQAQSTAASA